MKFLVLAQYYIESQSYALEVGEEENWKMS